MSNALQPLCRACGASNGIEARVCGECGALLEAPSTNPYSSTYLPPSGPVVDAAAVSQPDNPMQAMLARKKEALEKTARGGTGWFFWIAGLSLVNTVIFVAGGKISFIVGLGATQVIDVIANALAPKLGDNVRFVGFALDLLLAGMFFGFGLLARKRHRWVVVLGMLVYALDGLIFLWIEEWLSLGFHAIALFGLWTGLKALNGLKEMERSEEGRVFPDHALPPQTFYPS